MAGIDKLFRGFRIASSALRAERTRVDTIAKNIANADLDRSRVYLSLKAEDAISAIQLYVRGVGDAKLAAQGLHGVVAQKLLRTLCGNCKVAYTPTPEMRKKLGLPADKVKQLFKKGGQVLIRNKPEICPA